MGYKKISWNIEPRWKSSISSSNISVNNNKKSGKINLHTYPDLLLLIQYTLNYLNIVYLIHFGLLLLDLFDSYYLMGVDSILVSQVSY